MRFLENIQNRISNGLFALGCKMTKDPQKVWEYWIKRALIEGRIVCLDCNKKLTENEIYSSTYSNVERKPLCLGCMLKEHFKQKSGNDQNE